MTEPHSTPVSRVDLHCHSTASAAPRGAARCGSERRIAVAIHDVEPATFERCALIRDWLGDHGIDRATLLVIPAPDLHPFFQRRPDLAAWLLDCRDRGDAVAQHGFQHRRSGPAGIVRRRGPEAEFARMDAAATHASIEAGRRMLTLAGVEPRGFVAPAYAYTPALHAIGRLGHQFVPGDPDDLDRAIADARAAVPDPETAAVLAWRHRWDRVFREEAAALQELAGELAQGLGSRARARQGLPRTAPEGPA